MFDCKTTILSTDRSVNSDNVRSLINRDDYSGVAWAKNQCGLIVHELSWPVQANQSSANLPTWGKDQSSGVCTVFSTSPPVWGWLTIAGPSMKPGCAS